METNVDAVGSMEIATIFDIYSCYHFFFVLLMVVPINLCLLSHISFLYLLG